MIACVVLSLILAIPATPSDGMLAITGYLGDMTGVIPRIVNLRREESGEAGTCNVPLRDGGEEGTCNEPLPGDPFSLRSDLIHEFRRPHRSVRGEVNMLSQDAFYLPTIILPNPQTFDLTCLSALQES